MYFKKSVALHTKIENSVREAKLVILPFRSSMVRTTVLKKNSITTESVNRSPGASNFLP